MARLAIVKWFLLVSVSTCTCVLFLLRQVHNYGGHIPSPDLDSWYVETGSKYYLKSHDALRTYHHSTVQTQKLEEDGPDIINRERQTDKHPVIPPSLSLTEIVPDSPPINKVNMVIDKANLNANTGRSRKMNWIPEHYREPTQNAGLQLPSDFDEYSRTGFVLAIHFWDQQTYSIRSILGLQGWAAWLGVHTVEPFLVGTKFGFPLGDPNAFDSSGTASYLRMSDVYDIDDWNAASSKLHFKGSPLLPWDYFLRTASNNVIYVELKTIGSCIEQQEIASYNETLAKLGFKLLSSHCIAFSHTQLYTLADIKTRVYGNLSPHEVTVVFNIWSHINVPRLTGISIFSGNIRLKPSHKILNDADSYIARYLPSNGAYVGILVRSEWLIMNRGYIDKRKQVLQDCLKSGIDWLHTVMNQTHLTSVFVGMDIGKYGSTTLKDLTQSYILNLSETFLQTTYGTSEMTIANWEKTFQRISQSEVPGYVAFLQKTIATRGKCVLLIGGGSFQNHALKVYVEHHQRSEYCYLKTNSVGKIISVAGFKP